MRSRMNGRGRSNESTNWVLIAGGALLSTLSIRLGYKLKQVVDAKNPDIITSKSLRGNGREKRDYCFGQDESNGCYNCGGGGVSINEQCDINGSLPLVRVSAPEFNKENGVMWSSSPDRLELPQKHSNSSDSVCMSEESATDIYSKREVIHKLRHQLKRRDEMILEMQDQIAELQNSLGDQLSHSAHLQSLLDAVNNDLLASEREIQRLRKAIADHCVESSSSSVPGPEQNGRVDMLKREVSELKEVIQGKEFLVQSYKEQKVELTIKLKDLQHKLDSQLPNIL